MSKSSKVRIEVVTVPNTSRDIKNKTGKSKKILPTILQTFAPVLGRDGHVKTGTTVKEFDELMAKDPMAGEISYKDYFSNLYVKVGIGGKDLDLTVTKDLLIFNFLQHDPEVCTDLSKLNPSKHVLIMIDKELEAEQKLTTAEAKMQAYAYLNEMDDESIKEFMYLYGKNPDTSPKVAKATVAEHIESNPGKFVKMFEDSAREYKISFKKLFKAKIIEKRGGVYYYGEDVALGSTNEQVVEFLRSATNQELYINLLKLIEEDK